MGEVEGGGGGGKVPVKSISKKEPTLKAKNFALRERISCFFPLRKARNEKGCKYFHFRVICLIILKVYPPL